MLRILNDEDGFEIKARELSRLRIRNGWLVRAPNGDKAVEEDEDDNPSGHDFVPAEQPAVADPVLNGSRHRARRKDGCAAVRFPSETTLNDARRMLNLDDASYRALRAQFQCICHEMALISKTMAGADAWEAAKARLACQIPRLRTVDDERERLALDIICTDVTKRLRSLGRRMSQAEAKKKLGIDPDQSRRMHVEFRQLLAQSALTCKSDASPQLWEELKRIWAERSGLVQPMWSDAGGETNGDWKRALEVLAGDVVKRVRDERGRSVNRKQRRQTQRQPQQQQRQKDGDTPISFNGHAFDEAAHAYLNSVDTMETLSLESALLLVETPSDEDTSLFEQADVGEFEPSMDDGHCDQSMTSSCESEPRPARAAFMRLQPGSGYVPSSAGRGPSSNRLWVAALSGHSMEELRAAAEAKFPGSVCVGVVEGVLRDGRGHEMEPLRIERDQELGAYLTHLEGMTPTFGVRLEWKALHGGI